MTGLIAVGALVSIIVVALAVVKAIAQGALRRSLVAYRLGFPRELDPDQAASAFAGLSGLLQPWWQRWLTTPYVVLETHATSEGVKHYVLVPERFSAMVENVLQSALPSVRYERVDVPDVAVRRGVEHLLTSNDRPLSVDPAALSVGLLSTLAPLSRGETIVIQWIVAPHPPVGAVKNQLVRTNLLTGEQVTPDGEATSALRAKQATPMLLASGRIGVKCAVAGTEITRIRRVEAAWHVARAPGVHLRRRLITKTRVASAMVVRRAPVSVWPGRLNAIELAGFSGWPVGIVGLPGLRLGGCRQIPASPAIPQVGTVVCDSTFPGDVRPLAMNVASRLTHVHIVGPTGTGKSNLISQLAIQDMEAGLGVILIDGKGDLCDEILARVPAHRRHQVVVFDPSDVNCPVGINPLETAHGASAEVVVENLVGMFKSLYANSWGPRLEYILRSALLTLAAVEGTTLCEVPLLLTNDAYRRRLVGKLDDPIGLETFWGWYEGLSDAERQTAISPVMNKLQALATRPTIRSIIGQANPALNLRNVMAEGKIVICSLASGLLGDEAAALLGALIVAETWHATTARASLPKDQRTPVMVHIDEWARFVHLPTPMATVLAEARGLGVGLVLAHQGMDQLTTEAKSAVLSNARSRVLFQLPAADARIMAREIGTMLTAEDLQGLGTYEVVAQLFAEGHTQAPATGRTRALGAPISDPAAIRAESRSHYGVPREDVERALRDRQSAPTSGAIGRKPRSGGTP